MGIYGLAYAIASGVSLFWTAINTGWLPWMLRKLRDAKPDDIAARAGDMICAVAYICVFLGLVTPELVALLAPPAYHAASNVVPVLLLASFLQFVQTIFLNVQFYRKRSAAIMTCSVAAALINVVFNLLFIKLFGFAAAAYVIAASHLFQLLFHYAIIRKSDDMRLVDGYQLIVVGSGTTAATPISLLAQHMTVLRWLLVLLVTLALGIFAIRRYPVWRSKGNANA